MEIFANNRIFSVFLLQERTKLGYLILVKALSDAFLPFGVVPTLPVVVNVRKDAAKVQLSEDISQTFLTGKKLLSVKMNYFLLSATFFCSKRLLYLRRKVSVSIFHPTYLLNRVA